MGQRFCISAGVVLGLCAGVAHAQSNLETFQRQIEQVQRDTLLLANPDVPIDQRSYFDFGAYLSAGYLSLDDNNGDNHGLRQYEIFPYARLNIDGVHEFFARGRAGWRDFNDGDSFDGRGDERIDPDLDAGYYRFDLQRSRAAYDGVSTENNVIVKGGRDLVYWANGLVLSEDIDGATINLMRGSVADLYLIAGVTPVRTVDFDSSRPSFDFNTRRGFYGAMFTHRYGNHRPYVYGLLQQDYNRDDELVIGSVTTEFDYDSYYLGVGSSGSLSDRWLYASEFVYEGGHSLSNSFSQGGVFISQIEQTEERIEAWAANIRLDYLLTDERNTRLSGEFIIASGDDDRLLSSTNTFGGNAPGTKDRAFNGFGLLNTGLAFAPQVSNLMSFRLGMSTFPFTGSGPLRRVQFGADGFVFLKTDPDAPISETIFTPDPDAVVNEPPGTERFLGLEPDVFVNWQITNDVTLSLRYGLFFPNEDVFGDDDPRQFFFTGVTYAF